MYSVTCSTRHCDMDRHRTRQTSEKRTWPRTGTGKEFVLLQSVMYSTTARVDVLLQQEWKFGSYCSHRRNSAETCSHISTKTPIISLQFSDIGETPGWKTYVRCNVTLILFAAYGAWSLQDFERLSRTWPKYAIRKVMTSPTANSRKWHIGIHCNGRPKSTSEDRKR